MIDSPVAEESSNERTGVFNGSPPAAPKGLVVQTMTDALRPGTAMSAGSGGTAMARPAPVEIVTLVFSSAPAAAAAKGAAMNWNASVLISNVSLAPMPAFGKAARRRSVFFTSSVGKSAGRFSAIAVSWPGSAGGPANISFRNPWSAVEFWRTSAASPNSDDGVAVRDGVVVGVADHVVLGVLVAVLVIEGLVELEYEGLIEVV